MRLIASDRIWSPSPSGTSSLLLSSYDQRDYPRVKCIDLGFASTAARLTSDETSAAMARGAAGPLDVIPFCTRADDLHALAYVVLELVLSASASTRAVSGGLGGLAGPSGAPPGSGSAPSRPTDLQSLKRLIEDVFSGDASFAFRDYCAQEPEWLTAVRGPGCF